MAEKITILIPVFNDYESLTRLLDELAKHLEGYKDASFSVVVVNDGSTDKAILHKPALFTLDLLHLKRNIGHQKAIAVGLAYIKENVYCDKVLIMDADGEDKPEDALLLLRASNNKSDKIVFALRRARRERNVFKFFYWLYKLSFFVLTGKKISFGNFMIIPKPLLEKIVYYSEINNHLAGGIIKSKLAFQSVPADRGMRYIGKSKMSFHTLLLHGLGAIAVFVEIIAARLLIFSLSLIGISVLALLVLAGIKAFTHYAIPGWTSTVMSAILIILLQSFLLSLFTVFLYFTSQSQQKYIPGMHYKDYTGTLEHIQ